MYVTFNLNAKHQQDAVVRVTQELALTDSWSHHWLVGLSAASVSL